MNRRSKPIQTEPGAWRTRPRRHPGRKPIAPSSSRRRAARSLSRKTFMTATGYFHPFVRMPKYIWQDQKAIWTSPFHTSKRDMKWWLIFGGATGALIASDKYVSRNAPNTPTLNTLGNDVSYLGEAYTLLPIASGFYFLGTAYGSDHFRETGLLSFEALADVTILQFALEIHRGPAAADRRQRQR